MDGHELRLSNDAAGAASRGAAGKQPWAPYPMLDRIQSSTLKQLFIYWEQQRDDRPAPSRADFLPSDMVAFLPNVYLIDVEEGPRRFRVRLMGAALIDWCGRDFSGRCVDEITDQVLAPLHELVTSGEPWLVSGQHENVTGRVMLYELLALPMSSDGATVNMILGGIAQVPLTARPGPY